MHSKVPQMAPWAPHGHVLVALESLLLATADVFSFLNKRESYEDVVGLLEEEQLLDVIFYEVIFFVPGKT